MEPPPVKVLTAGGASSSASPAAARRKGASSSSTGNRTKKSSSTAKTKRPLSAAKASAAGIGVHAAGVIGAGGSVSHHHDQNVAPGTIAAVEDDELSPSHSGEMDLIALNDDGAVAVGGGGGSGSGGSGGESDGSARRHQNPTSSSGKGGRFASTSSSSARRGAAAGGGGYRDHAESDEEDGDEFVDDEEEEDDVDGKKRSASDGGPVVSPDDLYDRPPVPSPPPPKHTKTHDLIWLAFCFFGIMASFVCYGLLLEYSTSGGKRLHELSFLFVTSALYTMTAAAGRYVRDEEPSSIPPAQFAVLGLTSMGSTFCSVRSLRYVIYPIQVLAKSCKPVPVMIMGAFMGKRYPLKKYINVLLIVLGVGLFMGGGGKGGKKHAVSDADEPGGASQIVGILLLFVSLCFDGGTGAYEDKLMSVHSVGPFDLMYNIQLGKTILAGVGLLVLNQVHVFLQMCQDMGFLLVALGLSGAMGQVFIFVTIAKFGALTCSIIGLARKVTTLVASIYFYGHHLNSVQFTGLFICITSMVMNFWGKSGKKGHGHGGAGGADVDEERRKMLSQDDRGTSVVTDDSGDRDVELGPIKGGEGKTIC